MSSNLKTPNAIWSGALGVVGVLSGLVHDASRRIGEALWAQRLKTHLVVWPVALMAIGGLNRFADALSKSIGDILGTETLYPAKMWVTLLISAYLIWAMYAILRAFKRSGEQHGTDESRPVRASAD